MKSWFSIFLSFIWTFIMALMTIISFSIFLKSNFTAILEINLFSLKILPVQMIFLFDCWTLIFSMTVFTISLSVFIFSGGYLRYETFFNRFHLILAIFVFSMLLLIFSPGLFSLFLGWDGLGLSSFLLVIYFSNQKSLNAGLITFMTNRLGDGLLLCGAALGFMVLGFNPMFLNSNPSSNLLLALILIGAFTKSAQIPFSAWLPAAMAAPTPVSSLVHSSTLVTAGVYLLFRIADLLSMNFLSMMFIISMSTMLMASISALMETDMKKIVALSTLSQLGLMVTALAMSQHILAFFHLITHAFFKALMFVAVGTVMHSMGSYQELKSMGSAFFHPLVMGILVGANFSLCGLPFFSGFFSKEMIILGFSESGFSSVFLYGLFILSIILTQLYSIRFFIKASLLSLNYMNIVNFSTEGSFSYTAFLILLLPAIMTGSVLSFFWKMKMKIFFDTTLVKLFLLSMLLISLIASKPFFSSKVLFPSVRAIFQMWFIIFFSSSFLGNPLKMVESPTKKFLSLIESLIFYPLQIFSSSTQTMSAALSPSLLKISGISLFFLLIWLF